ncbi:two-component system response regulator AlgR [Paucibacter oligotrophus]|uniref:Two-component system response regulator AlgR n=1 Tax=Roseateles oligotrophus TaxID=1769250 RepID=A0A840L6S2_9BURK|nr:LytTR family DNA-binding domain-containing protein [Roseateles oligotrophus]MBB4843726.1 two-component system response regulator AlgR [Roseateles oligotrophus]
MSLHHDPKHKPPAKLAVLLVDDEPLARMRLRSLLEGCQEPAAEVLAEAGTASQAQAWLREHACDLILLDIQMPGLDGLQLAESLAAHPAQPAVVFVTAHAEHALRGFELDAMDYLTKPVRRERLQAALARVAQRLAEREAVHSQRAELDEVLPVEAQEFINISVRGRLLRVPLDEVLYFKADLKYLTLRTATQSYVMDGSLAELETRFAARPAAQGSFLRVHRNALVAKSAVRELLRGAPIGNEDEEGDAGEGWAVRITSVDEWLAVSRRQVAAVREALAKGSRKE